VRVRKPSHSSVFIDGYSEITARMVNTSDKVVITATFDTNAVLGAEPLCRVVVALSLLDAPALGVRSDPVAVGVGVKMVSPVKVLTVRTNISRVPKNGLEGRTCRPVETLLKTRSPNMRYRSSTESGRPRDSLLRMCSGIPVTQSCRRSSFPVR
jgi:hypothetical protein